MIVYSENTYKTATSYISVLEFKNIVANDYLLKDKVIPTDDLEIEKLLEFATSIFDNKFTFKSTKLRDNQRLEFPRTDFENYISDNIKTFIAYTCIQVLEDTSVYTNNTTTSDVKREKLDVLEVEYFENKKSSKWYDNLNGYSISLIKKYISSNFIVPVYRG